MGALLSSVRIGVAGMGMATLVVDKRLHQGLGFALHSQRGCGLRLALLVLPVAVEAEEDVGSAEVAVAILDWHHRV